jgi:hypothetical protein
VKICVEVAEISVGLPKVSVPSVGLATSVSVVTAKLKTTTKGKLMNIEIQEYGYNPSVTELRQAYEVAYGEFGEYHLVGAMFASMNQPAIERVYQAALNTIRNDLKEKGLV